MQARQDQCLFGAVGVFYYLIHHSVSDGVLVSAAIYIGDRVHAAWDHPSSDAGVCLSVSDIARGWGVQQIHGNYLNHGDHRDLVSGQGRPVHDGRTELGQWSGGDEELVCAQILGGRLYGGFSGGDCFYPAGSGVRKPVKGACHTVRSDFRACLAGAGTFPRACDAGAFDRIFRCNLYGAAEPEAFLPRAAAGGCDLRGSVVCLFLRTVCLRGLF